MKGFLFSVLTLSAILISQNNIADSLASSVDRHQLGADETLNLTITLDDAAFSGSPDLAGLESNFQIISQRSSSSTTFINGNYKSKKEWHYILLPKKTGKLLIPSFKLKSLFSDAIEVDVLEQSGSTNNNTTTSQQPDLFLEQDIDKKEAFVQERLTLTLKIFTAIQIARPEIPPPSLSGFMLEKIGQAEYQSKKNGRSYYVLEYKYGLFPNKSGKAVLPGRRYQISQIISNGPRSLFNIPGLDQPNTQARFLSTPELAINIKAQPANLPAPYWLPSEEVVITDNWPEQQTADVGTALTRTITITALGNLAAHIPPLPSDIPQGLKSYIEQPELGNTTVNDNFLATRKENIAIVPVRPGTYLLPAISLYWWDTKNNQFKTSTLPERTLTVRQSTTNTVTPSSPDATLPTPNNQIPVEPADFTPNLPIPAPSVSTPIYMNVYLWMAIALFLVILWIITIVITIHTRTKSIPTPEKISDAEDARHQSTKKLFKTIKLACEANNAKVARDALLHWAQRQWPNAGIQTLDQLKKQVNQNDFSKLLDTLDESIYGGSGQWDGKELLNFLLGNKLTIQGEKPITLPNLYD